MAASFHKQFRFNPMSKTLSVRAEASKGALSSDQVAELIGRTCSPENYKGKRVLLVVPDGTRTAPVGLLFQTLHRIIGGVTQSLDVMIALGTHQPMSESAICERLEISEAQRKD